MNKQILRKPSENNADPGTHGTRFRGRQTQAEKNTSTKTTQAQVPMTPGLGPANPSGGENIKKTTQAQLPLAQGLGPTNPSTGGSRRRQEGGRREGGRLSKK